jgi:formylglycine-generating enzyme required for sulfatase activity/beta-lactamase class A
MHRAVFILLTLTASTLPAQSPEVVRIPAGTFNMGRSKLTADDKTVMRPRVLLDDRPLHKVTLRAFAMDATETTHAQYAAFTKATNRQVPYHWTGGSVPTGLENVSVYNVNWDDANAYCQWRGMRLPTEAEWERAARGGLAEAEYPWGGRFEANLARHNKETGPGQPGRYSPNAFGLYDMAGNMAEWTSDWFEREYYAKSPAEDPKGPSTGAYKIIRGGAWSDPPSRLTVYFRNWVRPSQKQPNIGIRCARDVEPAADAIRHRIAAFAGTVHVYAKNLSTGQELAIRADEPVRTASTIKLPILIAISRAVADGKAAWEEELLLKEEDKVSGSGILREMSSERKYPLRDLANLMIVVSDNTATNLILDRFTADYVNDVMEQYGLQRTRVNRKVLGDGKNLKTPSGWSRFGQREENKVYGLGVSTPREMVRLLEMLVQGKIVDADQSLAILAILKRQQYKDGLGRRIDEETVASKSGSLDRLRSDVGIVTAERSKIAIAITVDDMPLKDYSPENAGSRLIGELTPLLLEALR